jgi:hypothetical protein
MVSDLAIKTLVVPRTPEVSSLEKSFMEAFLTFLLGPRDVEDAAIRKMADIGEFIGKFSSLGAAFSDD